MRIQVEGSNANDEHEVHFDPKSVISSPASTLMRPKFLAIVSSTVLAATMAKKSTSKVDGFVIEHYCAGGHNAPPRGGTTLDEQGEPVYSQRDEVDLEQIKKLGLPFWLAGSYGFPDRVQEAIALGAQGVQVGSLFAFCQESRLDSRH